MAADLGASVRVRLLGPIDVVSATGEVHTSGSALRRALLASLALRASEVVSSDWLLEHAWGAEPPDSGLRALRFHISQLRRELPDPTLIETRPGGYRLDGQAVVVDVAEAERLVREATASASPDESSSMLNAALAQWRGIPFVDAAPCAVLDDEAQRLDELRLTAIVALSTARLAAGASEQLIPELTQLVAQYPLHETLWSILITAQYRAGRQTEALRSVEELRAILADSAGLSPSAELLDLQQRILQQDPLLLDTARPPESRPTGTVTFLLTDVEGSTRLWESHPSEMKAAIARHDELLRTAIVAAGGSVFSTGGDGFGAAFQSAAAAIRAAIEGQRTMFAETWPANAVLRVRMGIHSGEAEERGGDYFGQPLNRAARVMATVDGGQIAVSATAVAVVDASSEFELVDLGRHELKGISEPIQIYGVAVAGLPAPTVASRPALTSRPGNLPRPLTSFIGREDDVAELTESFRTRAVTTVVGTGGAGKTRLAIEAAGRVADEFAGGVWFVDLSAITDPAFVTTTFAAAVGVVAGDASDADEARLAEFLRPLSLLVVVDNCEQVVDAIAGLVERLVQRCPELRVAATSRQPLDVAGERVRVLDVLSSESAADLFRARAQLSDPDFAAPEERIRELCARVDHLPLAIELAAARVRAFSLEDLLRRLDASLSLLVGSRSMPDRHRTVEATIQWSVQLLDVHEARLLAELAVFSGGFGLDAVEAVATDPVSSSIASLLESLVLKSLVVTTASTSDRRYRLLETVRAHAGRMLVDVPTRTDVENRFLDHVIDWSRNLRTGIEGPQPAQAVRALMAGEADLRAAHDLAIALDRPHRLVALVAATGPLGLRNVGAIAETGAWIDEALAVADADPADRLSVRGLQANLWFARPDVEDAVTEILASPLADPTVRASALNQSGWLIAESDVDRAIELEYEAVEAAFDVAHVGVASEAVSTLVNLLRRAGRIDEGFAALDRIDRLSPDGLGLPEGSLRYHRGFLHLAVGTVAESRHWFEEALRCGLRAESKHSMSYGEGGLGMLALIERDWASAGEHYLAAHRAANVIAAGEGLDDLALWAFTRAMLGDLDSARSVLAEVERDAVRLGTRRSRLHYELVLAGVARAEGNNDQAKQHCRYVAETAQAFGMWLFEELPLTMLAEMAESEGDRIGAVEHRARAAAVRPEAPGTSFTTG